MSDRTVRVISLALLALAWLAVSAPSATAAGAIAGTVRDASNGQPLAGATVWLEIIEGGCPTTRAETDAGGRYAFGELVPGRYRVRATQRGYAARYHGEGGDPSFGSEIVVMPGERRRADVSLPPAAEVSGHIHDADGRPLARGYVFFDHLSFTNRSFHTMTDGDGYYWVADLPPGDYRISARRYSPSAHQVVGARWFHPGTTDEQQSEAVPLTPGRPAQVDILFGREPAPTWSVLVQGASGEPVARAEVALRRLSGPGEAPLTCRTDEKGLCSRSLAPGEYEAFVARAPAPYGAGGREAAHARRFRVERGRTTLSQFRLGAGLSLAGAFRAPRGRKADPSNERRWIYSSDAYDGGDPPTDHGLRLTLTQRLPGSRASSDIRVEARVDGETAFVFDGLGAGFTYVLEVSSRDPLRRYCVTGLAWGDVALDPGRVRLLEEPAALSVEISPCAVLVGRASGREAIVLRRIGGPPLPGPLYPAEQRAQPSGGRFAFRGLPAGRYVVERLGAGPVELRLDPGEVHELLRLTAVP